MRRGCLCYIQIRDRNRTYKGQSVIVQNFSAYYLKPNSTPMEIDLKIIVYLFIIGYLSSEILKLVSFVLCITNTFSAIVYLKHFTHSAGLRIATDLFTDAAVPSRPWSMSTFFLLVGCRVLFACLLTSLFVVLFWNCGQAVDRDCLTRHPSDSPCSWRT